MTHKPIPIGTLATKRAKYYTYIFTYEKRREELRKKFPPLKQFPRKYPPEYKKAVVNINKKLKYWNRTMNEIDKTKNQILAVANAVATFTGINVRGYNGVAKTYEEKLPKYLFYKWGLEAGIEGKLLREYIGARRINQPADYRREFNKLLTSLTTREREEGLNSLYLVPPDTKVQAATARAHWQAFKEHLARQQASSEFGMVDKRKAPGA